MKEYGKYLEEQLKKAEAEFEEAKKSAIEEITKMNFREALAFGAASYSTIDKINTEASKIATLKETIRAFEHLTNK